MNCKNCSAELKSEFCPDCDKPKSLKRIDGHYIIHEIEHVLHFERGILFTIRALVTNPGESIRNYFSVDRNRLVKPVIFIIVTSLIYSFIINYFHIDDQYVKFDGGKLTTSMAIFEWIQSHYGYANIIIGIFIAFWLQLFFRKHRYNIFEIVVLLCYITGISMLIYSSFAVLQGVLKLKLMVFGGMVGIGYCAWAIGHFFGKEKILNYVKALLAYTLGLITFAFTAIYLGVLIDYIKK